MLVVDTVGFAPGVLSPPVLNSDKLHVVERFSLDPGEDGADAQRISPKIRCTSRGSTPAPTSSRSPTCRTSRIPARSRRSSTIRRRRPTGSEHERATPCADRRARRPVRTRCRAGAAGGAGGAAAGGVTRGVDRAANHAARVRAEGRGGAARRQRHPRRAVRRRPADDEGRHRRLGSDARAGAGRRLSVRLRRRRRAHARSAQPGNERSQPQRVEPDLRAGVGRVRHQAGTARRGGRGHLLLRLARHVPPDARLHAAGLRDERPQSTRSSIYCTAPATATTRGPPPGAPASSSTT